MQKNKFLIIAGEASGDNYGASIIEEIIKISPEIHPVAIGGEKIKSTNATMLESIDKLTVVGLAEVIKHLSEVYKILKKVKIFLKKEKPAFVILIDFPDFNFKVAKYAYSLNIPVFYFVSPQVWAWREGRVKFLKKYIRKLFVIFPFEVEFYKQFGMNVKFVGHPLASKIKKFNPDKLFKENFYIGLLPGSRNSEVSKLLPIFLESAKLIKKYYPKIKFLMPVAATLDFEKIKKMVDCDFIDIVKGESYNVIYSSKIIISASGTATLESALFGKPVIIVYKVNLLSYLAGRLLINIPYIGMPNLLNGNMINPELIQFKATPEQIFIETRKFIENKTKYKYVSNQNRNLLPVLYKENTFLETASFLLDKVSI